MGEHLKKNTCFKVTLKKNVRLVYNIVCFPFIFISWRLITLQYCSGFCQHDMNQPWIYMCPRPDPNIICFMCTAF